MLQEAKDLQNSAVTKLVNVIKDDKKEFTFKAPTGSGKTYMMSDFMNRILSENENVIFIVSTLSKSNLAEQNYRAFKELSEKGTFPKLNPFLINSDSSGEDSLYIPTDYNVYVLPRDLYKDTAKLKKEGTFLNFLQTITNTFFETAQGKRIYLIKDECHIATNKLDELKKFFHLTINFSATPKLSRKQAPDVEITNLEAESVNLIKKVEKEKDNDTLEDALQTFEEIKGNYINDLEVNPCLIIQISNSDKADEELNNTIFPALSNHQDLKWVYITGEDKTCKTNDAGFKKLPVNKWKDYMKSKTSSISVIIFKMVISEAAKALNSTLEALGKLHSEMDALSAQLPEYEAVMDMYGVGKILGSQLIAEIGDIRKLHSGKALVVMAGIDPPPHQSGTVDTRSRSISKRGSPALRKTLFQVIGVYLQRQPKDEPVYQFLEKKRTEGKPYKVYMIAAAHKFLRIYYARIMEVMPTQ